LQGLFPPPILKTEFLNYMLSNQNFMAKFPARLSAYCNERSEDDKTAQRTGRLEISEKTDIEGYLLSRLMQELAESCYKDFYKPYLKG
jgi:hypothetical protein